MAERCPSPARELLAEAALGLLAEPERGEVLAHAARCPSCWAELDGFVRAADHVLGLAPAAEPPPGFEERVLSRLGARRGRRRWWAAAAAFVVALAAVGAVALSRDGDGVDGFARAELRTADGDGVGEVLVAGRGARAVVLRLDEYRDGVPYTCQLVLAGGEVVDVDTWTPDGGGGEPAWRAASVEVAGTVVGARMVLADGTVWASAEVDPG